MSKKKTIVSKLVRGGPSKANKVCGGDNDFDCFSFVKILSISHSTPSSMSTPSQFNSSKMSDD